jgi:hypothetical protein
MRNLNEGKKKSPSYMAELSEIDKQSAIVAMEAKINHLQEMADKKKERLNMVSEDENLSELIDKKRVKMMEREIKEIEKAKLKLEKLYEKACGSKPKEMVDEDARTKAEEEGYLDGMKDEKEDMEEGYNTPSYEEDDTDPMTEEFNRFRKLAGIPLKEDLIDDIKKIKDYNKTEDSLKYKKYDVTYDKDEKMYSVFLRKGSGDSSDIPEFESESSEEVKNFLEKP